MVAQTADDVWRLLGELVEAQKETDRKFKETEQLLREQSLETERRFQETERQFQETKELLREQSLETERRFQETEQLLREQSLETKHTLEETSREIRRVNQQLNKQLGKLGGKWGRFLEDLVAPACEKIFLQWGVPVHQVSQRVKRRLSGDILEVDVLVINAEHVMVVEVKSSLSVEDVRDFVSDLGHFRQFFPEYAQKIVYGAVAGMGIEGKADRYAYRQGLFVLAQSGDLIKILNDPQFQPKLW